MFDILTTASTQGNNEVEGKFSAVITIKAAGCLGTGIIEFC